MLNSATVVGDEPEPNTANNRASAPTLVRGVFKPPVLTCPLLTVQPRSVSQGRKTVIKVLVTRTTKWDVPHAAPSTSSFVKAGASDLSALFVRMRSRRPSSQMPPLGTRIPDREGMALVAGWIESLSVGSSADDSSRP